MRPTHRRTAMKVKNGRVLKKNNWRLDPDNYHAVPQSEIRLDRRRPAENCRHLITLAQLRTVIELLPDWDEVAIGLDAIVLDSADDCAGWYGPGVVAVCGWEADMWHWWDPKMEAEHRHILDLLDVERVAIGQSDEYLEMIEEFETLALPKDYVEVRWNEPQARAYQLLHILPHELGHHHDRITTRSKRRSARGEPYAEAYANRVLEQVFSSYAQLFEL